MLILMGENQVKSRNVLNELKKQTKAKGKEIIRLKGKSVELAELKQAMESESLFGGEKLVVIEEVFSSRESSRKQDIKDYLKEGFNNLIVWEGKKIDKRKLKGFDAEIKEFEVSSVIFKLTDSLSSDNTDQMIKLLSSCLEKESPEMIFYMITRQVRLMLQAIDNADDFKGPGWLKGKMKRQAKGLGKDKLLKLHENLYMIDKGIKTGGSPIGLDAQLEMLLISL